MNLRPPRQRLKADQRQDEIVRAAVDLAARNSPETITTLDIARELDLTQGAIFRHFPTKESIWVAVLKWAGDRLMGATAEAAAGGAHPVEALERMFYAHVVFVSRHPAIPRLLFRQLQQTGASQLTPLIRELIGAYRARLVNLLSRGKQLGLVRADVDEQDAAALFIGMVQGLVIQSSIFGGTDIRGDMLAAARRIFPIYLQGIRAHTHIRRRPSRVPQSSKK